MSGTNSPAHELLYFIPSLLANTFLTQIHLLSGAWLDLSLQFYRAIVPLRRRTHPWGPLHPLLADVYSSLVCLCLLPVLAL